MVEYCYYQNSLGTGQNPVTIYISNRQIDIKKMSEAQAIALLKHMIKLYEKT
jgi:hypothetical protein